MKKRLVCAVLFLALLCSACVQGGAPESSSTPTEVPSASPAMTAETPSPTPTVDPAFIKNNIPYEGLDEDYINSTLIGTADRHTDKYIQPTKSHPGYYKDYYSWYADNGKDVVLIVECKNGVVTRVSKYYTGLYWTEDGLPNFGAQKPKPSKTPTPPKKEDPYNVYDYTDPEDFYYDNYDDFWDYEDAEDYFNEHQD